MEKKQGGFDRFLGFIERAGNKVPHPALLFVGLCVGIVALSQLLAWSGWHATYEVVKPPPQVVAEVPIGGSMMPGEALPPEQVDAKSYEMVTETVEVKSLLSTEGIRFMFTSFLSTFMGFTAMGIILIVMIGVGASEASGLIASLIRKLVAASSQGTLTYIIVGLGIVSSIASDAGYLVLIPLGAAAFVSVGRHPLAGMAAAFAGVAGGFGVNFLITPTDAVLTEITNESIHLVDPSRSIDITANLYFGIGSTIVLTILLTLVSNRLVEPRLGTYDAAVAPTGEELRDQPNTFDGITPEQDARGLRWALIGFLAAVGVVALLTVPSGAPLRDPVTGGIIGTSPFMDSLIVIIALLFLAAGIGYVRGAGTLKTNTDLVNAITKSWAGMAGLLFLFLLIAQFISYFNYSRIPQIAAVKLGGLLGGSNINEIWLLLAAMAITLVIGIIMPQAIAKWALLAPIFIPLFLKLGVAPESVLAAYRVADSPMNIVTPIMAYFPLIVVFAKRYDKRSGIGTVITLMLPFFVALVVVWTLFFVVWYSLGIPFGPGT